MPKIFAIGDTHDKERTLSIITGAFKKGIIQELDTVIQVGDAGLVGLAPYKVERYYSMLHRRAKERNIQILIIRGNHDNPAFFRGQFQWSPYVRLCNDHDIMQDEHSGIWASMVGGACGIDRHFCTPGKDWWPEIMPVIPPPLLEGRKVDIVFAHSLPGSARKRLQLAASDFVLRCLNDPVVQCDIKEEGDILETCFTNYSPKVWVCGHFHVSADFEHRGTQMRVLNCNELKQIYPYPDNEPERL